MSFDITAFRATDAFRSHALSSLQRQGCYGHEIRPSSRSAWIWVPRVRESRRILRQSSDDVLATVISERNYLKTDVSNGAVGVSMPDADHACFTLFRPERPHIQSVSPLILLKLLIRITA
jgi:hypothetical protein